MGCAGSKVALDDAWKPPASLSDEENLVAATRGAIKAKWMRKKDLVVKDEEHWKRLGGNSISALLSEDNKLGGSPVALVDARFLIYLAKAGGRLLRRQDLPRAAFIDLATLRKMSDIRHGLRVLCVSYPWHTPTHPDPKSTTLQLLARILEKFVEANEANDDTDGIWGEDPAGTCAVFLDFCSLYQKDAAGERTANEQQLFDKGLKGKPCISELYSHPHTFILKVTSLPEGYPEGFDFSIPNGTEGTPNLASYYDRGWCFCESSMGNLVKKSDMALDLAKFSGQGGIWRDLAWVVDKCRAGRPPPLAPARFKEQLEEKSFTSKKTDLETVGNLYEGAFEQRMAKVQQLNYPGLGWKDEDAKVLSEVLGAAKSLWKLNLYMNAIGDEGVKALATALREDKAPKLKAINLGSNRIGDEGVKALAAALCEDKPPKLEVIELDGNRIGDEGVYTLAAALRDGKAPKLKEIDLGDNPATSDAAKQELRNTRERLTVIGKYQSAPPRYVKYSYTKLVDGGRRPFGPSPPPTP